MYLIPQGHVQKKVQLSGWIRFVVVVLDEHVNVWFDLHVYIMPVEIIFVLEVGEFEFKACFIGARNDPAIQSKGDGSNDQRPDKIRYQ